MAGKVHDRLVKINQALTSPGHDLGEPFPVPAVGVDDVYRAIFLIFQVHCKGG
jgi:hypothetical protein